MKILSDVLVIGGGPAGVATAIAASQCGFQTTVLDARLPPIDKPCVRGIVAARDGRSTRFLESIWSPSIAVPFAGIRFADEESSACSEFPEANGFCMRRVKLHELLVERATRAGVNFLWGAHVTEINPALVMAGHLRIGYRWLVGADGQDSMVRKWAGLHSQPATAKRFGFRRHFQIRPWANVVEVYWANGCQVVCDADRRAGSRYRCILSRSQSPDRACPAAAPCPCRAASRRGSHVQGARGCDLIDAPSRCDSRSRRARRRRVGNG